MVPEGKNNQETSVAMVQFYGVLTEPSPEFQFLNESNDWFKIGAIETVKKKKEPEIFADINVEVLSFAPATEVNRAESKEISPSETVEQKISQNGKNLTKDIVKTTPPIQRTEETTTVANTEKLLPTTTEKMISLEDDNELKMPEIDLQIVNVKSQLPVKKVQYIESEKLTLANYEVRVNLNESVATEMIELKIEPQQFLEIRPRFILNGIPAQIRIKTTAEIAEIKEMQIFATYADVESDKTSVLAVGFEVKSRPNPFFNQSSFEFVVPENSESGVVVGEVHATDPTKGDDSGLIYSLIGKSSELFFIDQGQIRLFDHTFQILDKDSDAVNSNSIVFQGSAADFLSPKKISDKSFEIEVKKLPEIGGYVLTIITEDSTNPQLKPDTKTIKVEVLENLSKSKFGQRRYEKNIRVEKLQPEVPLVQPVFSGQPLETVRFTFLDDNPGWLAVDELSGNVYVDELPKNGVAGGAYNNELAAISRETNKIIDKCVVRIVVEGSQKQSSIFKQKIFSFALQERECTTFKDFEFSTLNNQEKKFSIIKDTFFAIDESSKTLESWSSVVKIMANSVFISKENLENSRIIQFELSADDNPNDRALVTINAMANVQKYKEKKIEMSKPMFSLPWTEENQKISIKLVEEAPLGHVILHIFAYNPENGEINKNISLQGENADYFTYDTANHLLLTNQLIDYETVSLKTLFIDLKAGDQFSETVAQIEVIIQNVDDNAPKILQNNGNELDSDVVLNVEENSSPGTELLKLLVQDKDDESKHDFTANLVGEDAKNYQLKIMNDSITILTSSESNFDFETNRHHIILLVVADHVGNKDVLPIHVYLNNTNDVRPYFEMPRKNIVIVDNWPVGAVVGKIFATDKDSDEYSFSISGNATKFLSVNEKTGELLTALSLNGLSSSEPYSLEVKVADNGIPSFTSTLEMEIQVKDAQSMDDSGMESLRFKVPTVDHVLNIPENTTKNTKLLVAEVVNGNGLPANVEYSLVPVTLEDKDWLSINSKTGEIYVDKELDFERAPYFTVEIIASSFQQRNNQNISRLFRIAVQNVDDMAPKFAYYCRNSKFSIILDDDAASLSENTSFGRLQAIDTDAFPFNKIYYYLLPQKDAESFYLDAKTGELFKHAIPDEAVTSFELCAVASPLSNLGLEQLKQIECDIKNSSLLQFTVKKLSSLMNLTHHGKLTPPNNAVINIDPNDYKVSFNQKNNETDNGFLYKLQDVQFFPLMKNMKQNQPIPEGNIFVTPNTGEIQLDPEIIDVPEGIYLVKIKAFFVKTGEYAGSFISQIHKINPENKLKFVFNENLENLGSKMDSFKQNFEKIIQSSTAPVNDMEIVFSVPKVYEKRREQSFACFHIARQNKTVSKSEAVNITSTKLNTDNRLADLYQRFNVINIDNCQTDSEKQAGPNSQLISENLLFWIVGISIGFLILFCLVCHVCFVTRYKDHLRHKKGRIDDQHPIQDPFMVPQFIDPRRI
uniref:Cadherin domain-containing protein n=1 Tax=Panagrolaimus sp. JU765 TaxID=591449 RepID=A0AC34QGT9_9BILA